MYSCPKKRAAKNASLWLISIALVVCSLVFAGTDLQRLQNLAFTRYGRQAADTVEQWRTLIESINTLPDADKIIRVNDFFNTRIKFVDDLQTWGQEDYWATPLETMGRRQGDCEDFSIAKYATLLLAGVDVEKLRITYVRARLGGPYSKEKVAHMVLAYYPQPTADPLVLDNLIMAIRPASRRPDLTPVFGFNSEQLWVGSTTKPTSKSPNAKLSKWRDLLQRMKQDGLG